MAYAMIYPDPDERGRGKKGTVAIPFSKQRLSYARTVLREAADLAPQVLNGSLPLDPAYKEVMLRLGRLKTQDGRRNLRGLASADRPTGSDLSTLWRRAAKSIGGRGGRGYRRARCLDKSLYYYDFLLVDGPLG
jgi:hypothetical protein